MKNKWWVVIVILAILLAASFILAGIASLFMPDSIKGEGNVAVIPIKGFISMDSSGSSFGIASASAKEVVEYIQDAASDPGIKAIIFEINSPGGSTVAPEEISKAIRKANKTTVAVITEVGASSAYWIASATDRIFASRMSLTGSIGTIISYLEFEGFMEDHNITYRRLVSGKYKDLGSPFKEMTSEEERIMQDKIIQLRDIFIEEVAKNRGMEIEDIPTEAEIYLGTEALELGLIDELGGIEEAKEYIEEKLGITAELAEYRRKSFFGILTEASNERNFFIGKGIGSAMLEAEQTQGIMIR